MGNHRCCCKKGCAIWTDFFDRTPEETAPDGINYLGSTRYTGALSDWHITGGKLIADAADSQINFHDGGKRIWHVRTAVTLPNVGDHFRLHYDAETVLLERTGSSTYRTTMAGETWDFTSLATPDFQLDAAFFPRSRHGYYFDKFTTPPDSDLVSSGYAILEGAGDVVCQPHPDFTLTGIVAARQNLGSGFNVWGMSGSAGVEVDQLELVRSKKACWEMLHGCCSVCWDGLPPTAIITASGFSGTYSAPGFHTCDRTYFNGAHVCDPDLSTAGCAWKKNITYSGTPACDSSVGVQLFYSDPDNDQFIVSVVAPWSGAPSGWESAPFSRADVCNGETITLTPVSGSPTGTLTLSFA